MTFCKKDKRDPFLSGLTIDEPSALLPWSATEAALPILPNGWEYKKVGEHYYTLPVLAFDRLFSGCLGLHFDTNGKWERAEFFEPDRKSSESEEIVASFEKMQRTLESYMGKPSRSFSAIFDRMKRNKNEKKFTWNFRDVKVIHSIWDRFGLEDRLEIVIK